MAAYRVKNGEEHSPTVYSVLIIMFLDKKTSLNLKILKINWDSIWTFLKIGKMVV